MSTFKLLYHTPLIDKNDNIDYVNIVNNNNTFIHNKMNKNTPFLNYTSGLFINMNHYSKFEILKMFLFNPFLSNENKEMFINYFCKIQKQYQSLSYLAYRYKFKTAKVANDKDLCYNNISKKQPRILSLYVKNTKYLFSISDLKNIINTSLYNCDMMFSLPLSIKNPYDNSPFSKANLYNIYFFFKHNDIVIPTIYHLYFMTNFHMSKFQSDNEVGIRNYLIDNYLRLNTKYDVVRQIKKMLTEFNSKLPKYKILLNNKLPEDLIYNSFKRHVQLYYKYRHTLDLSIQENANYEWIESLKQFKRFNPVFGRRMLKLNKETKKTSEYFKEAVIPNTNNWFNNDMNSHLDHTYNLNNGNEDEEDEEETFENENTPQHTHFTNINYEMIHSIIHYTSDNEIMNNLSIEIPNRSPSYDNTGSDTETDSDELFPPIVTRTQFIDCFSDDDISDIDSVS